MREFYQGSVQCAESGYQIGHRGANFTDYPPAPPTSRTDGVAPTNGTPPDDVNPVVCPSPNFRPRPGILPGVQQGVAPIPATTNDAGVKNLSPYLSAGFLPIGVVGRSMDLLSPIQQASDCDDGGLNRHQACYIQPTRTVNTYFQDHSQLSPSELPNVRINGFPHASQYSSVEEGVLIYCSEVSCHASHCVCTCMYMYVQCTHVHVHVHMCTMYMYVMYVHVCACLLYTSPSPRDATLSRMPSSA